MANPVVLDSKVHRNTKVITSRGAQYGENIHFVPVVANELPNLVLDYPVFLMKDHETGQFGMNALLGFDPGENLYLSGDIWDAGYVPMHVRRQPFMVAFQAEKNPDSPPNKAVVTIDMDSKRVQENEGEALFNDDGSSSNYLAQINSLLANVMSGIESTKSFISAISDNDLIKPSQFEVSFSNGEKKRFEGFYTLDEEKLNDLSDETLLSFYGKGYLQACYLMSSSMGHVNKLVGRKNKLINS